MPGCRLLILKQRAKNLRAFYAKVLEYQIPTGMLLDLEISFFVFEGGQWADQVQGLETTATGSVLEIQPAGVGSLMFWIQSQRSLSTYVVETYPNHNGNSHYRNLTSNYCIST